MNNGTKVLLGVLALVLVVAIGVGGFTAGFVTAGVTQNGTTSFPGNETLVNPFSPTNPHGVMGSLAASATLPDVVSQVQQILKTQALVPPKETSLTAGTIDGMLKSLNDPYAMYFDPTHYNAFNEMESGQFGGIGVTVGENKKGQAYVVNVLDGTPAKSAGVRSGDIFSSIDGSTQPVWTSAQVVKLVRGKPGTRVTVGFMRAKETTPVVFTMTREQIKVPNTKAELVGPKKNIGYIRLFQFTATAADDIRSDIATLTAKGAQGFILDLRDNPGGLLEAGVDVTSLFVKSGPVVRVDERGKPEHTYYVTGDTATNKPLVVLVDADSASASEITAGALQDYARATIVGVRSFGKGSVQTIVPLPNGGGVKFTIAHYLTPKKRVIDHKGVLPEVIVPMDPLKQESAKTDTQMQQAITVMQQKLGQ